MEHEIMKKETRRYRALVWAVILLLILNLSTIATILMQRRDRSASSFSPVLLSQNISQGNRIGAGRFLSDRLGLSPDQVEKGLAINAPFRASAAEITDTLLKIRNVLFEEMRKANPDTALIRHYSKEIGAQHAALKWLTAQYYLDLKKMVKPSQWQNLDQWFGPVFFRESGTGTGPGQGRQRGGLGRRTSVRDSINGSGF